MLFLKARQAARFRQARAAQSDEDFLTGCGFEPGTPDGRLAISVRRVIAECGSLEREYIHDDDRWPDELRKLDFWDSIDFLHFLLSVERATGLRFRRDEELHKLFYSGWAVSELVRRVVPLLGDCGEPDDTPGTA